MKLIKSILSMVLVLILVKSCYFLANNFSQKPIINKSDKFSTISTSSNNIPSNFIRMNVGNGVFVSIPQNWYFLNADQKLKIYDLASNAGGNFELKNRPLSVNSSNDSSNYAMYKISFVSDGLKESDIVSASQEELDAGCDDIHNYMLQNPSSVVPIGVPKCSVVIFNDKIALLASYKRYGEFNSTWTVNILTIPLLDNTAMITFSKRDGFSSADDVISLINSSVEF